MSILNLDQAPSDPIERILWLGGVNEAVKKELDEAYSIAYYEARLERRFDAALRAAPHSKKRVLAYTRKENERRGRTVRWGDAIDPTSSTYSA